MPTELAALIDFIAPHLAAVDWRFMAELKSEFASVNTLVKHVSRFRGKMLGQGSDPGPATQTE